MIQTSRQVISEFYKTLPEEMRKQYTLDQIQEIVEAPYRRFEEMVLDPELPVLPRFRFMHFAVFSICLGRAKHLIKKIAVSIEKGTNFEAAKRNLEILEKHVRNTEAEANKKSEANN